MFDRISAIKPIKMFLGITLNYILMMEAENRRQVVFEEWCQQTFVDEKSTHAVVTASYVSLVIRYFQHPEREDVILADMEKEKRSKFKFKIDLIDMCTRPSGDFRYILHLVDHFSKFQMLHALRHKSLRKTSKSHTHQPKKGCGRDCKICEKHLLSPINDKAGEQVKTDLSINCPTNNVLYGIYCAECGYLVYIGETRNMLKTRIQNHLSNIRCESDNQPVPRHVNQERHNISDFHFVGLERIREELTHYRRQRESRLIKKHGLVEQGLYIKQMDICH